MFYGLNKFFKNLLPKQLFYRGLLIVATPIIILQITITIVFFDSLWIKTNKGMTRALVAEIKTFINAYENEDTNKEFIISLFKENLDININYKNNVEVPEHKDTRWFSPIDRTLRRELKSNYFNYWFDTTSYKKFVDLKITYDNGHFEFLIPKDRLTSSSARIFVFWITLPALLVISVAMIFLKNQTRPIIKLAEASEKFGKGEDIGEFTPSGALEIRKAGYEFDKMRKRIKRHLKQRSEMLSGISHDLRTPLTRIKLQLAFINDKKISNELSEDVDEMEKMLNEYLQFAKTGAEERTETFDICDLINAIYLKYKNTDIKFNYNDKILIQGRKELLKRCFNNFIENSIKNAKKIQINAKKIRKNIVIDIEDDGPGIPKKEYDNVFKPFYKIDKSRSVSKSSVGLGLSISSDIIKAHGGKINLDKSKMGGLKVTVILPF
ncbi:MAG: sensor histidine kinase [Candidatus Pelagibacter sp. TMED118]|nr:MAG: sensor histidine kinase [Candidatus Pelagibacter sp. TMED118]|tara:strand:- start:1662 stop:2975 length:1314 start_codon:yes stop_codon:yes gene_type:complete